MIIGIPKEIKHNEYRVEMEPAGVQILVIAGHKVSLQKTTGIASSFAEDDYVGEGAEIKYTIKEVYDNSDMIIKVKERLEQEYEFFREDQILFTYLHLAATMELTLGL